MSIRLQLVVVCGSLFMLIFAGICTADLDGNGSLDDPAVLTEGTYFGNVTMHGAGGGDKDVFMVQVPPLEKVTVSLKKIGEDGGHMKAVPYGSEKERMEDGPYLSVDFPGEVDIDGWMNRDTFAVPIYFVVQGDGNYSFGVSLGEEGADQGMHHWTWFTAELVEDGSYSGLLYMTDDYYEYMLDDYYDIELGGPWVHYYRITVPEGRALEASLEKGPGPEGAIFLESNELGTSRSYDDISISVSGEGENRSGSWDNLGSDASDVIVKVYGVGNYTVTFDTTGEAYPFGETEAVIFIVVMMMMMVFAVLIPLAVPLMIVIAVVIVVIVVLKRSKRVETIPFKEGKKRRKHASKPPAQK